VATPISVRNYSSTSLPTSLLANVDNQLTTTNIPVQSTTGFPATPFTGCFERNTPNQEFVLVTAIVDMTHFTVVRAYDGTPAVAHNAPATFEHCVGAIDYREANWHHTDSTRDDHLQYLLTNGSRASTGLQAFNAGISTQFMGVSGYVGSNVAGRYMGATAAPGPPGAGTFQVGDWVLDTVNCRWLCIVAGTPGTWMPEPGRVVMNAQSPAISDAAADTITWSSPFTAVKGATYVIDAAYQGTIITAAPNYVNVLLYTSPSVLAYNHYVMTIDGAAYVVGNVLQGSTTAAFVAPSTESIAVAVNVVSSGSGGLRTLAGGINLIVRTG
jgi:hypothetical protein